MLETAIVILGILVFSLAIQKHVKIPMPNTVIGSVLSMAYFNYHPINIDGHSFDSLLLMMLPLLITADALHLKPELVKKHWKSIALTAGLGVTIAIGLGVLLQPFILPGYEISIPLMVMLLAAVIATDPVTTGAIFSNYELPEDLKFLVESESLFNDASAIFWFSLMALLYEKPELTPLALAGVGVLKIVVSVVIGLIIGYLAIILLELVSDKMSDAAFILLAAMVSFAGTEHFHGAGILSVVLTILVIKFHIAKKTRISERQEQMQVMEEFVKKDSALEQFSEKFFSKLHNLAITAENEKGIINHITFLALFANTVLFASMASLFDITLLVTYWKEILAMFIGTFVIRGIVMAFVMIVSNRTHHLRDISFDWWTVMTSAGVKGGLSILLLHLIPNFEHKELFEAIIVGNILLSTFVYTFVLTVYIKYRKEQINEFGKTF